MTCSKNSPQKQSTFPNENTILLDGREVAINGERNILEIARREGIDIPSFCYHSELSIYGACRMCMVEIEGQGMAAACSTTAEPGMKIKTITEEIRSLRQMNLELILANHDHNCTTCAQSGSCRLQDLAQRLGVDTIRFPSTVPPGEPDTSSPALNRNPAKCILCGDCVRACREIQGIGVIDFAERGPDTRVVPAFDRGLGEVECVNCGQCSSVCPTGALDIKPSTDQVWTALHDPETVTVVQIAPAVRTAFSEPFNGEDTENSMGRIIAALKRLGFDYVLDTCFAADLTAIEETHELIERLETGGPFPLFTSCCPAWVKYCEQYHPELLEHLSTCRSPQQMFGAVLKNHYAEKMMNVDPGDLFVVSIMPCTAKKFEAVRPEFSSENQDVDAVLSTVEAAHMVQEAGIQFENLPEETCNYPPGMATGAGMIFGVTGGVTEAVLRTAAALNSKEQLPSPLDFEEVRGMEGVRESAVDLGDKELRLAVVHGLKHIGEMIADDRHLDYDVIEVMACPGGCIGGGGQPSAADRARARQRRAENLYLIDTRQQLRIPTINPAISSLYDEWLECPGTERAHSFLHTTYSPRRRMEPGSTYGIMDTEGEAREISVCVGTGCYLRGSYDVIQRLIELIREGGTNARLSATFCLEHCDDGVSVKIGEELITGVNRDNVDEIFARHLDSQTVRS